MSDPFAGLRPYQIPHAKNVLRALTYNKGALDASDTGVGKTYTALACARIFGCVPLVLGPKGVRSGWEDASQVMNVPIQFINYEKARNDSASFECPKCGQRRSITGNSARQGVIRFCEKRDCARYGMAMDRLDIDRLGYEKPWGQGSFWVWNNQYQLMIFDEAHLCGGSTSLTGKLLRSARKASEFVLTLSATAADSPEQMKNIGQVLGLFDGKGFYNWSLQHAVKPNYSGFLELSNVPEEQEKAMAKIHAQIFPVMKGARLRRKDVPGFPQTQTDILLLDPDKTIKGSDKEPEDMAERVSLCQKLERELCEQLKQVVVDEIKGGHASVVVFLNFTESLNKFSEWADRKGFDHGIIDGCQIGEKGDADRREIIRRFQSNEDRLILVNCAAGGAGLNLHDPKGKVERVSLVIPPASNGRQMKQILGRVQRDGGAFSRQYFCGLRGTYQEENLRRNQAKIRNIDALNGDELDSLRF